MTRTGVVASELRLMAGTARWRAAHHDYPSPTTLRAQAERLEAMAAVLDKVTAPGGLRLWWQNRVIGVGRSISSAGR